MSLPKWIQEQERIYGPNCDVGVIIKALIIAVEALKEDEASCDCRREYCYARRAKEALRRIEALGK